jgi:pyridine nucleotide-disulfide oxidoreductase family protein
VEPLKRIVLVGGGHAHLLVLRQIARCKPPDVEVTLLSPSRWQYYSGMLPGWIAGTYRQEECRIDLQALSASANACFLEDGACEIHAEDRTVGTTTGRLLQYDFLSLDIGSETACDSLQPLGAPLLPVKSPDFHHRWEEFIKLCRMTPAFSAAVVGAGAAGVELALAVHTGLLKVRPDVRVTLICGPDGPLDQLGASAQSIAAKFLRHAGIEIVYQRVVGTAEGVRMPDGRSIAAHCVLAATGARAPAWLGHSRLGLDVDGFVAVDDCHRSRTHPNVFAAGDVCSRDSGAIQKSGVQSVRLGPVLAHNLLAAAQGTPLRAYKPRRRSLYLLSGANGSAIACWGTWCSSGRWAWRLKDQIDRRFIRQFPRLPDTIAIPSASI